jgi:hypothetical protein
LSDSIEPRISQSPSAYREQNPYKPPPPEYKPPSMLAEHWGVAILCVAIAMGCAVYGWRALHAPPRRAPLGRGPAPAAAPAPANQPIYIEALPDNKSP